MQLGQRGEREHARVRAHTAIRKAQSFVNPRTTHTHASSADAKALEEEEEVLY